MGGGVFLNTIHTNVCDCVSVKLQVQKQFPLFAPSLGLPSWGPGKPASHSSGPPP